MSEEIRWDINNSMNFLTVFIQISIFLKYFLKFIKLSCQPIVIFLLLFVSITLICIWTNFRRNNDHISNNSFILSIILYLATKILSEDFLHIISNIKSFDFYMRWNYWKSFKSYSEHSEHSDHSDHSSVDFKRSKQRCDWNWWLVD